MSQWSGCVVGRCFSGAAAILIGVLAFALPGGSAKAQCGGICLYEQGTADNSSSAAGAGARAQDAATVLWNPAGMTQLEGHHLQFGTVLGFSKLGFDLGSGTRPPSNNDGGSLNSFLPLGGAYGVLSITEDLKVGLSFSALYGGSVDYNSSWAGRTFITDNTILGMQIQPAMAYRFNDWFSLGGSLAIVWMRYDQRLRASLDRDAPTLRIHKAEDVVLAGTINAMVHPREGTRFGLHYRSPSEATLDGTFQSPAPKDASFKTEMDLPQGVNLSFFHQLTPKVSLLGDGGWSDFSKFQFQPTSIGPIGIAIPRRWQDTWRLAGGAHYRVIEKLNLQTGISYDSSPVRAKHRLPDIPVGEQYRFSGGLQFFAAENITLGTGYTFMWSPNMEVDNVPIGPGGSPVLDGDFDTAMIHFFNFTLAVSF